MRAQVGTAVGQGPRHRACSGFLARPADAGACVRFLADNRPGDKANGSMTNGLDSESHSKLKQDRSVAPSGVT